MTNQPQGNVDSKTCPACGGTWPSDRRNCLACGTNLEAVPARPADQEQGPLTWTWLDAMADEEPAPGAPEPKADEEKPGCLARLLPGLGQ